MNIKDAIKNNENNSLEVWDLFTDFFCIESDVKLKCKQLMKIVTELSSLWSDKFKNNRLEFWIENAKASYFELNDKSNSRSVVCKSIEILNKKGYIIFKIVSLPKKVYKLMKYVGKDQNLEFVTLPNNSLNDIIEYFKINKV